MACPCGSAAVLVTFKPGRGAVRMCGGCGCALADDAAEPAPAPNAAAVVVNALERADEKHQRAKPAHRVGAAGTIQAAKAEARALRAEIRTHEAALKKARAELQKLDRLLDAAEARPRAVVRAIRTTA